RRPRAALPAASSGPLVLALRLCVFLWGLLGRLRLLCCFGLLGCLRLLNRLFRLVDRLWLLDRLRLLHRLRLRRLHRGHGRSSGSRRALRELDRDVTAALADARDAAAGASAPALQPRALVREPGDAAEAVP